MVREKIIQILKWIVSPIQWLRQRFSQTEEEPPVIPNTPPPTTPNSPELIIHTETDPLQTVTTSTPTTQSTLPDSTTPPIETFDEKMEINVLLELYPRGRSNTELVSRISGFGNPVTIMRSLHEKGFVVSVTDGFQLTDHGIFVVQEYLNKIITTQGIGQFYRIIEPYLAEEDPWAIKQYNNIMRQIIANNTDVLYCLVVEQSLDSLIMAVATLRNIKRGDEPEFVSRMERLIYALEALNLITIRNTNNTDYIAITDPCKKILGIIGDESRRMYRGELLPPLTTPQVLIEKTERLAKRFFIVLFFVITGALIVSVAMNFDLVYTCAAVAGSVVFLTIIYLYSLNKI